jgi:beta-lactamase regulating signal transducer with metallopeptidase domain
MDFVTQNVEVTPFLAWLARTSLQGSVLICLILLVQRIARGKLPVRWRYCFWLLLLARLALPWAPQSRMSVFNLLEPAKVVLDDDNGESGMVVVELPMVTTAATESVFTKHEEPKKDIAGTDPAGEVDDQAASIKGIGLLTLVWLTGAVVLAVAILVANFKLWWIVKCLRPLTDQKILDLLEDCKEQMGIRTIVAVVVTDKVKSPALFGFIRPRLLLPMGMIETVGLEELRYIFLHELAHLRRHDIYLGWITAVLQVLHWFNPLIWFGFYRMRMDRELACDGLAMGTMGADEPKKYGRTIVNLLERFSQRQYVPSMAGILENKANLKRRITMIANFKKGSWRWSTVAVTMIIGLACVALTNAQSGVHGVDEVVPVGLQKNLLLYYSFDRDGGTKAVDISGMDFHGKVHGAGHTEEGKTDGAMFFDGEDDYISIGDIRLSQFTFSAWVKTETEDLNNRRIFLLDDGDNYYAFQGNARGGVGIYITSDIEINEYDWELKAGRWTHLTVSYDGRMINIYKNGRLTEKGTRFL